MPTTRNTTLQNASSGRGFLSFCAISAGSAAFMILLSIGAYHVLYKGVPEWNSSCIPMGEENKQLSIEDWKMNKGRFILHYFSPFQSTVRIRMLAANGIELFKRNYAAKSGSNSITIDAVELGENPTCTVQIECCGRHAEQTLALR